ncbi:3-isopropylmalate dehydratase large subunit [Sphingomonadaceae bacterium OTU29LAMAA1]|nr:3-isopropylmalate dehydratase large subunit [Sphingomonadaceae bacterium OTU29LAMAA1]
MSVTPSPRTMLDKIWDAHVIRDLGNDWALLHIDRHVLHDLSGPIALDQLHSRDLTVRNPDLVFATPDHAVSSRPGRSATTYAPGGALWARLQAGTARERIRFYDVGQRGQGIVHVMAPEMAIALPGTTLICGDSHTCTNGGVGALAFGVGQSESMHALATQTLRMQRPKSMRVRIEGKLGRGVSAKDLALHVLQVIGTGGGIQHAIEYAGEAVRALDVEGRLTLCNLSVEMGARSGFVAPDDKVFAYLEGRPFAPSGAAWQAAVEDWRALASDSDAVFDRDVLIEAARVAPVVSWGIAPDESMSVDDRVPDPNTVADITRREHMRLALDYMGLTPGDRISDAKVDWVFIGSCSNARLPDLRAAADIAKGRKVAPGVSAWVVPGSWEVKRAAEAEGLDRIFVDAGFEWREPGCSMCVAANGETVPPGARCVSTSNRNFVGRQGPRARTHLASPATAAASAISGRIADARSL